MGDDVSVDPVRVQRSVVLLNINGERQVYTGVALTTVPVPVGGGSVGVGVTGVVEVVVGVLVAIGVTGTVVPVAVVAHTLVLILELFTGLTDAMTP